jgi:hypothetical protein
VPSRNPKLIRIREILRELGPAAVCQHLRDRVISDLGYRITDRQYYETYERVFGCTRSEYLKRQSGEVMPNGHGADQGGASPGFGDGQSLRVGTGGAGEGSQSSAEPPRPNPTTPPAFAFDELDELLVVREFCREHGGTERTSVLVNILKVLEKNPAANILCRKEQPK